MEIIPSNNAQTKYDKQLENISIIGTFDVLSLRKVSSIKRAVTKHALGGEIYIGLLADELAFDLQETVPLQEETRRAYFIHLTTKVEPLIITNKEALRVYLEEKNQHCRFIYLASENKVLKDRFKEVLEEINAVYESVEAYNSDNRRALHYYGLTK